MQSVTATFRNGRVELAAPVDWPNGTPLEVRPLCPGSFDADQVTPPITRWLEGFLDRLREDWGAEPFERPPQGELEGREQW